MYACSVPLINDAFFTRQHFLEWVRIYLGQLAVHTFSTNASLCWISTSPMNVHMLHGYATQALCSVPHSTQSQLGPRQQLMCWTNAFTRQLFPSCDASDRLRSAVHRNYHLLPCQVIHPDLHPDQIAYLCTAQTTTLNSSSPRQEWQVCQHLQSSVNGAVSRIGSVAERDVADASIRQPILPGSSPSKGSGWFCMRALYLLLPMLGSQGWQLLSAQVSEWQEPCRQRFYVRITIFMIACDVEQY